MKSAAFKNILICLLLLGGAARAEEISASTLSAQVIAPSENQSIPVATNSATRDLSIEEKQIYKFSFFSLASGRATDISRGGTSIGALNYIGFSRKTESNDQWGFRYVFYYDSAGYKFNPSKQKEDYVGHQTEIGDPYLTYAKDSLAQFSDWNLSYAARVYLPFSKFSQATKLVTQIRTEFNLEYPLFQFSKFNFITKTDYFVQTQKAYLDGEVARRDDGTYPTTAVKGTKQWYSENYAEIDANLSSKFSLKPRLGFEDNWYYGSTVESIEAHHDTDFKSRLAFDYRAAKSLSFSLALENRTALLNRKDAVAFGRPEDNRWSFVTYASY